MPEITDLLNSGVLDHASRHADGGGDGLTPAAIGAETTAQLDARDIANRDRANHTGTQAIATVSGLQSELDGKQAAMPAASQAEMEAGTETEPRSMSPANVAEAIAALAGGSEPLHVTTDVAKRNLTGLSEGQIVIIDDEAGRVEMYLGTVEVLDRAIVVLDEGYTSLAIPANTPIVFIPDEGAWSSLDNLLWMEYHGGRWYIADNISWDVIIEAAPGSETYPWEADWSGSGATVEANPEGVQANWQVVVNSFELRVQNEDPEFEPVTVNGVVIGPTNNAIVGWIRAGDTIVTEGVPRWLTYELRDESGVVAWRVDGLTESVASSQLKYPPLSVPSRGLLDVIVN